MSEKKLYRPAKNRVIAGVCGGLALYFGLSASLLRAVTLILTLAGGLSVWVYIVLWIITPEERWTTTRTRFTRK